MGFDPQEGLRIAAYLGQAQGGRGFFSTQQHGEGAREGAVVRQADSVGGSLQDGLFQVQAVVGEDQRIAPGVVAVFARGGLQGGYLRFFVRLDLREGVRAEGGGQGASARIAHQQQGDVPRSHFRGGDGHRSVCFFPSADACEQLQALVQSAGEVERIEDFAARVTFQSLSQGRGIVHPDHRHRPYGDGFQGYFRGGGCRVRTRENACRHCRAQADARAFEQAKKPFVYHAVHIVLPTGGRGVSLHRGFFPTKVNKPRPRYKRKQGRVSRFRTIRGTGTGRPTGVPAPGRG